MAKQRAGSGWVGLIGLWVKWVAGKKTGRFKLVKNGFGSIGFRVELGWAGLTCIFHMNFFFERK